MINNLTFIDVWRQVAFSLRSKLPILLIGMVGVGIVFALFSMYLPMSHLILFVQPLASLVSLSLKRSQKSVFSYKSSELVDLFVSRLLPITVVSLLCTAGIGYIASTIINADISLSYRYFFLAAHYVVSMLFYIPLSLFFYFGMVQAETIPSAVKDALRMVKENISLLVLVMVLFALSMCAAVEITALVHHIFLLPVSFEQLLLVKGRCLFIAFAQVISILFLSFYIEMYIMAKRNFFLDLQ